MFPTLSLSSAYRLLLGFWELRYPLGIKRELIWVCWECDRNSLKYLMAAYYS
ncbi:MAG: hypothetical protein HC903_30100 [Methylacidiphilales bacterium]|nr:hypothetical protein [Candidatus Methylacidiphilales bacterium]